jgi:hypothetical protein
MDAKKPRCRFHGLWYLGYTLTLVTWTQELYHVWSWKGSLRWMEQTWEFVHKPDFIKAVKSCPVLHFSVVTFSGPSGSLMPALFGVENWVPLKPVLAGVRDVALLHYPSCIDSNKQRLQFCCNIVVINASEISLCFQI